MLFNKSNNPETAITEFRKYVSFIYQGNNFNNISLDIELAEEDLIKIIGNELYNRAHVHYHSTNYELPEPTPGTLFNDRLVHYLQLPIALNAALNYTINNDVTHSSEGRKVAIGENEKIAWEWMIEADNRAILNKAHKTTDRLIEFLETNEDSLPEWKESAFQKEARALFINSAADFDSGFPIDLSRRFFLVLIPFMKMAENKYIKPIIGKDLFAEIKSQILTGELTAQNKETLNDYINPAVRYLTMAQAIKMLTVQILPDGVYQNYISERMTQNAKAVALTDVRREVSSFLEQDGKGLLKDLEQYIRKLNTQVSGEVFEITAATPRDYSETKHFRV